MTVIGITGTDGKTTTSFLIYHILKTAGKNVSLISTNGAVINGSVSALGFHVTNPASFPLQKFIAQMRKAQSGKKYLVLEVTSHGIDQKRIWGIHFSIAGLTNVTHEHLDYHKTYSRYLATKVRLLQNADIAVINKDDHSYTKIKKLLENKQKTITYSLKDDADITPQTLSYKTQLIGGYNHSNILLAIAVSKQLGIPDEEIQKAIATFKLPVGRADIVYQKEITVMVDFAHTPNALSRILPEARTMANNRLIHVFGSAGERDRTKRPIMGREASLYDDIIILTAEDPRKEDVWHIMRDIRKGMERKKAVLEIPDRQQAITKAISMAKKGDFVLLTGKAHETSMNYGRGEEAWNEFEAVKAALQERNNNV